MSVILMGKKITLRMERLSLLINQNLMNLYQSLINYAKVKANSLGESVPDRIASLSKSYIPPVVREKEVKPVEFGAKVNMIQFRGINFIEHISFSAFHEGIRLKQSVRYSRELVGKLTHLSGDNIYATNANRTYCKKKISLTVLKEKDEQENMNSSEKSFILCSEKKGLLVWREALGRRKSIMD